MTTVSVATLLAQTQQRLTTVSDAPRLEAELLLAQALAKPRSFFYTWPERLLEDDQAERFADLLTRRLAGEPLAYIAGSREFWSLELHVTPATLIPRPETELLVEQALARIAPEQSLAVAELGTGSGAVALAIAHERPRARVVATDLSPAALAVAAKNGRRLHVDNVTWQQGDWCAALGSERFDLIVANPPYVAATDPPWLSGSLRYEPRLALLAGADGLAAIRTIVAQAPAFLRPGGGLLLEHGYAQGAQVLALLRSRGFTEVIDYPDLGARDRVAGARWPSD